MRHINEEKRTVLQWNANGKDIYYQGTSDKNLPVIHESHILSGWKRNFTKETCW